MLQITDKGIVIDQLSDIHNRLIDGFKRIYGDDVNIDPDTPDGQMIGLFSQELANINQVMAFIVRMLDPYQATGEWLEQRALYAGVVRRGAEYSYIENVIVTGIPKVTIPKGSIFADDDRVKWESLDDVTLNDVGSARFSLRSQDLGSFYLGRSSRLEMETVIIGIDSIITSDPAKSGNEEETDGQLLKRFMLSHSINNYDDREGIKASLLALPDVKQAEVIENYTGQNDSKTGVTAHSLNAIVIGGSDDDIAKTLLKKKVGGCAFSAG